MSILFNTHPSIALNKGLRTSKEASNGITTPTHANVSLIIKYISYKQIRLVHTFIVHIKTEFFIPRGCGRGVTPKNQFEFNC